MRHVRHVCVIVLVLWEVLCHVMCHAVVIDRMTHASSTRALPTTAHAQLAHFSTVLRTPLDLKPVRKCFRPNLAEPTSQSISIHAGGMGTVEYNLLRATFGLPGRRFLRIRGTLTILSGAIIFCGDEEK